MNKLAHRYGMKPGKCVCPKCLKGRDDGTLPRFGFSDVRITDGRNVWMVSGTVAFATASRVVDVKVTEVHGDITDHAGLRNALRSFIDDTTRTVRAA